MQLRVFDYDLNSANDLLGFNVIPLALIKSGVTDLWLKIQPEKTLEKLTEDMTEVCVCIVSHMPACCCNLASDRQSAPVWQQLSRQYPHSATLYLLLECGRSKLWCELVQRQIEGDAGNIRVARVFMDGPFACAGPSETTYRSWSAACPDHIRFSL